MSHKVKGQSCHCCQNKKKIVIVRLQRTTEGSVSSVSCKKPEATVVLLLFSWSKYPNIVAVSLFDD